MTRVVKRSLYSAAAGIPAAWVVLHFEDTPTGQYLAKPAFWLAAQLMGFLPLGGWTSIGVLLVAYVVLTFLLCALAFFVAFTLVARLSRP